jgi:hypothetical protein
MKEPFDAACDECRATKDSDFSCFFRHATAEQKETIILFAAKEGWKEGSRTLAGHLSEAAKSRWAKTTPEERSAYAKKMVKARELKRAAAKGAADTAVKDTLPPSLGA